MLGSLYFSEVIGFEPCTLCWYQRILMYPLVLLLGIALVRKDYDIVFYSLPMSCLGACLSLYQYVLQKIPSLSQSGVSCGRIPCTGQYINWLGFITIPFLALTAFIIITICGLIIIKTNKEKKFI
jgi:disulfide bond formation protein DsbB